MVLSVAGGDQDFLLGFPGTVIVVSHDKQFLNVIATDIIHFHQQQLKYYPGNYDNFEKTREDKFKKQVRYQGAIDRQRQHMEASVKKIEAAVRKNPKDQKRLGTVASRKKKLLKHGMVKTEDGKRWNNQKHGGLRPGSINANEGGWSGRQRTAASLIREVPDAEITFHLPSAPPLGTSDPLIQFRNVSFSYPEATHPTLRDVTGDIAQDARIAVVGENGAGKSTLIKLLLQQLAPASGEIRQARNTKIAYLSQHHVDQLDLSLTPADHIKTQFTDITELDARQFLGSFGISGSLAVTPMGKLSGGQKTRVVIASIFYKPPHLIVLDEPTNHLSIRAIDALVTSLKSFKGAILAVTHNQAFVSALDSQIWQVEAIGDPSGVSTAGAKLSDEAEAAAPSNVTVFTGGYEAYIEAVRLSHQTRGGGGGRS